MQSNQIVRLVEFGCLVGSSLVSHPGPFHRSLAIAIILRVEIIATVDLNIGDGSLTWICIEDL